MAGGDTGQGYVNEIVDMANSGDTSGFTRADWKIIADNPGYTTPRAAAEQQSAAPQDSGGGGGGGDVYNYDTDPETLRMREMESNEAKRRAADEKNRTDNAIAVIRGLATDYGLMSLYDKMVGFITDGYNAEAIMSLIRDTSEYKTRFPAMAALMGKGRAITENDYINYERNAAQLEQMYGLPKGMVLNNVTALLTNEVSGDELRDRVVLSSAASVSAPQQLKDSLRNFYGIDSGGLAGYFLDPAIATPILEKQFATAVIGSEALRQDVNLGLDIASNLQEMGVSPRSSTRRFLKR